MPRIDGMNCDHYWIDVTNIGDRFKRMMCAHCSMERIPIEETFTLDHERFGISKEQRVHEFLRSLQIAYAARYSVPESTITIDERIEGDTMVAIARSVDEWL